jgi:hypothetical protein
MPEFEVGIYNSEVRKRVEDGRHHTNLTDDWAEIHYIDVEAADQAAARSKLYRRYPEERGFVIESCEKKIF